MRDRAANACNSFFSALTDYARKAIEGENYHRICDQRPPPELSGKALQRWKLKKALECWKARQDFTNKWYNGKFNDGHAKYMEQLRSEISKLANKLGY